MKIRTLPMQVTCQLIKSLQKNQITILINNKIAPKPFFTTDDYSQQKTQYMKKTSIRIALGLAFSALLFTACKKDNDEAPANVTKESIAGKYKLTDLQMVPPAGPSTSMMGQLQECEKDNIYTLNTDFSAKYEDAGKSCGGEASQSTTWSLDGKNITVKGGTMPLTGIVKSWDGKTLVIDAVYEYMGVSVTLRGTLAKQ